MRPYVLTQGESLTTLAVNYSFDADATWNDPKNDDLRAERSDPDALAPCDVLYIPEPTDPTYFDISPGTTNTFTSTRATLFAALKFQDEAGQPVGGEAYVIDGLASSIHGTTSDSGTIDLELPADATAATICFPDLGYEFHLSVAHLDPSEEDSGVDQRLRALGFNIDPPAVIDESARLVVAGEFRQAAIAALQSQSGLEATGLLDDDTRQALVRAHGA